MDLVHFLIQFCETSHLTWEEAKESQEEMQKSLKDGIIHLKITTCQMVLTEVKIGQLAPRVNMYKITQVTPTNKA